MEIGTLYRKRKTVEEETVQKKRRNEEENSSSCSDSPAEYECIMDGLEFAVHPYDIGLYVNSPTPLTDDQKYNLLVNTFTPAHDYNFKGDSTGIRSFRHIWLIRYSPWLCYSSYLKGPFCKYCIVFPQPDLCGRQGGFIMVPFVRYNDFHVCAKKHMSSAWHKSAEIDATNFLTSRNVFETNFACQLDSSINRIVNENRKKLHSILSTIIFCGTHDIPLHGETRKTGNMKSLLAFRVEAGDVTLREHLENEAGNARDTSAQIENELIKLCVDAIREEIVSAANGSAGFSVLVGESTEISGEDHVSLGIRFVDTTGAKPQVREEFLGFAALKGWDATCTAETIIEECTKYGLNLEKLCGQGYDGCSRLAGREGGVQAKIKSRYPKATLVHCAAHTLNLVVNDSNAVPEIRNAVGTIKAILRFFRENLSRRNSIQAVPSLGEALWTAKYKHVRFFSKNFVQIFDQLRNLAATASGQTCQDAYQLYCASGTPNFLFCLVIMSNYCTKLESVTQALQTVQLDMMKVYEHIQELLTVFRGHREKAEEHFKGILSEVRELADKLDIDLRIPRQSDLQRNSNASVPTEEEYFRQSLYIPYLNSVISWLERRFPPESKAVFGIFSLHPQKMAKVGLETLKAQMEKISELYEIENLETETITWFEKWLGTKEERVENGGNGLLDLLQYIDQYPSIQQAISIALALPVTTCTMEKSFSTMRRVETLLTSTVVDDQLSGLCMMSAHRVKINENKDVLVQKVIDRFGEDNRRLQFVFEK
ncbi:52 kDa repressor of the inhibitor of the protein kinase-like [Pituophis catenifer annectens]|uniref:52 kDa repressor of the inhibitor of the protein kinase-like n=1 Tax=Pituophis catenifer annectens TaxID=94852 RepID=UPI003995B66F